MFVCRNYLTKEVFTVRIFKFFNSLSIVLFKLNANSILTVTALNTTTSDCIQ